MHTSMMDKNETQEQLEIRQTKALERIADSLERFNSNLEEMFDYIAENISSIEDEARRRTSGRTGT